MRYRRRAAVLLLSAVIGSAVLQASPAMAASYQDFYSVTCTSPRWAGIYGTTTKYTEHEHTSTGGATTTYAYSGNNTPVYHFSAKYRAFSHAAINTINGTVTGTGTGCYL